MTSNLVLHVLFDRLHGTRRLLRLCLVGLCCYSAALTAEDKRIIGWIEPVTILSDETALTFAAKIDSGADYSSVDVESHQEIIREGETWIRFELEDDDGQLQTLERPLYKVTRVKRKGTESQPRYVVMLDMCLGGIRRTTRFSLVDRHNYKYRLLIGRDFLRGRFVIDPELRNTTAVICPKKNE